MHRNPYGWRRTPCSLLTNSLGARGPQFFNSPTVTYLFRLLVPTAPSSANPAEPQSYRGSGPIPTASARTGASPGGEQMRRQDSEHNSSPIGRTMVARDFRPWMGVPCPAFFFSSFLLRPGGRTELELGQHLGLKTLSISFSAPSARPIVMFEIESRLNLFMGGIGRGPRCSLSFALRAERIMRMGLIPRD